MDTGFTYLLWGGILGDLINLEEYRQSNELEQEYLKFLTYINKYLHVPTDVPELVKCFYFILRYLEGTVNAFEILSVVKRLPPQQVDEMRNMVMGYMDKIIRDMEQY